MLVRAVMVQSVDGRVTRGAETNVYAWSSPEDQDQFFATIRASSLIIMGSGTYLAAKPHIILKPETLRIVLTSRSQDFQAEAVPGQLEFSSLPPTDLVADLHSRGYAEANLVGGAQVLGSFLDARLVNELVLTVEPVLFGAGAPLVTAPTPSGLLDSAGPHTEPRLELKELVQLNSAGTLKLTYQVLY